MRSNNKNAKNVRCRIGIKGDKDELDGLKTIMVKFGKSPGFYPFDIDKPSFSNKCRHFDDSGNSTKIKEFLLNYDWPVGNPPKFNFVHLGGNNFHLVDQVG